MPKRSPRVRNSEFVNRGGGGVETSVLTGILFSHLARVGIGNRRNFRL